MKVETATATEIKNNFGYYLDLVMNDNQVIITKNGKEVGRFISKNSSVSYLSDSLLGVLKKDYESDDINVKRVKEKYGSID